MIFDRILSPDESGQVLAQLQALQSVESFQARALVQDRDRVEQWHIEVDRAGETWFAAAEHGSDPAMRNTMVFDTELGIVTRTVEFDPATVLVDIEPGEPIERHIPTSFPELEVIYPEY